MTRMPNPGRGPGGLDLNAMMKQVQQIQSEMAEAQEKLKDEVVEASAGGGMVKVKMSGDLRLLEIAIDPEAIDPEDAELLQDMVTGRRQRGDPLRPGAGDRASWAGSPARRAGRPGAPGRRSARAAPLASVSRRAYRRRSSD